MDYSKVITVLTEEIVNEFDLSGYDKFVKDRIKQAVGIGYDMGRILGRRYKSVVQLSHDGKFIREWETAIEVKMSLGIDNSKIGKVCRGQRDTTGGFKWEYTKDYYTRIQQEKENIIQKRLEDEKHSND